jgi:ParB-like chromosome segregation protein Spo0J
MGWEEGVVRPLPVESLGEHYRRYRLADLAAEEAMAHSLRRYGQQSPVVVRLREGVPELIDGFKRRAAAPQVPGMRTLSVRVVEIDERLAKAAIHGLNSIGHATSELEDAWIVQALVREDGLSQVAVAELLGKHKSWVNRRLAMLERLCVEAKEELRLGLVSPSLARQLVRLPAGNQAGVLSAARREAVTLLRGATPEQERLLLDKPREALAQAEGVPGPAKDPRLSPAGNRVARQLSFLLETLGRMENWLRFPGLNQLGRTDRAVLAPRFERLERDARLVAELIELLRSRQTPASLNEVLTGA